MNRKVQSFAIVATAIVCCGGQVGAQQVGAQGVDTQQTVRFAAYSKIQQWGRWCGWGWGDGYHACQDSSCRPLADLPPKSFSEKFRPSQAYAPQPMYHPAASTRFQPTMPAGHPIPPLMMSSQSNSDIGVFGPPLVPPQRDFESRPSEQNTKTDSYESKEEEASKNRKSTGAESDADDLSEPLRNLDRLDARTNRSVEQSLAAARLPQPSKPSNKQPDSELQSSRPMPKRLPAATPKSLRSARLPRPQIPAF
ncbi:hypothetical protein Q31b_51240 [Novipirellula aureliae]|uniref:Secreted protein n=1 Tax=Novipirellula aureliae TaxID=2527966 RepID=A0A5C6DLA3_9BACT|nr:hypothetical protein [Novipirellula aureliae]TWU35689.1 hypothetical protein Q31b_51240 [Novipirellula aureliae]